MNNYQNLSELPITLNVKDVACVLRISIACAYNLFDEKGFPTLRVGKRKIVPRERFIEWLNKNTEVNNEAR